VIKREETEKAIEIKLLFIVGFGATLFLTYLFLLPEQYHLSPKMERPVLVVIVTGIAILALEWDKKGRLSFWLALGFVLLAEEIASELVQPHRSTMGLMVLAGLVAFLRLKSTFDRMNVKQIN
jgi:hypothetical protein